jgi:hypothetical protein
MMLWKKISELVISKKLTMGKNATIDVQNSNGTTSSVDLTELASLDFGTAGTVTASKMVVVDSNKDIGDFRNLDAVNFDAGASGTAGSVDVFPSTASKGKIAITAADSAGNTTTTITNASQSGARTYTIPDAGASASFVMTEGAQTVNGVKTLGSQTVFQTATSGLLHGAGTSGANHALGSTADNAMEYYLDATHTTGDMRGEYLRLYFSGAGGSGEAARIFSTINNVSVATGGTVNGAHISIGTAGASAAVSGAANALRATFGIAAASTNIGGTCSVIQVDTDFDTAVTVPTNFAFLRFTNTNTKKSNNLLRIPNVAAETGGLFCAHTTQTMTHSIKIVSEGGTAYYIMCTDANTNRTES